jgi:murein DD-endopeptidase MepM/ murein hydrolase activator NlpD
VTGIERVSPGSVPLRRPAAGAGSEGASPDARRVAQLAAEFESMLLVQMLREMRAAGSWKIEGDDGGLGAEPLFEALDAELASYLAQARGFGLAKVLSPALAPLVSGDAATTPSYLAPSMTSSPAPIAAPVQGPVSATDGPAFLSGTVTSPYGWRRDPFHGGAVFHKGVDVRAAYGEAVGAAAPGRVVFAGEQGGYGHTVVVEHDDGLRSRYAHLSALLVNAGDRVVAGASIGRAGHSGRATGTHVHVEVTRDGQVVDPSAFLGGVR